MSEVGVFYSRQTAVFFLVPSKCNGLQDPDKKFVYESRRPILECISWAGFKCIQLAMFQALWVKVLRIILQHVLDGKHNPK
jgi:hypothetical protein